MRCIASAKRVQVPRRDPTGGGKISERSMLIFDYTAHKSASPKNYPVFLALSDAPRRYWHRNGADRTSGICNRQEASGERNLYHEHSRTPKKRKWRSPRSPITTGRLPCLIRRSLLPSQKVRNLALSANSRRGLLFEFQRESHPADSTYYVNAKDKLSLSLLRARLVDLKLPIKIVEGEQFLMWIKTRVRRRTAILIGEH